MKESEKMINFVSANDAKIELFNKDNLLASCSSVDEIVSAFENFGFNGGYFSSSMDFASEYGFDYDSQAVEMFEAAQKSFQKIA